MRATTAHFLLGFLALAAIVFFVIIPQCKSVQEKIKEKEAAEKILLGK